MNRIIAIKFMIVIPVADRPQHLQACLQSLLNLCHYYRYGGFSNNKYSKVSVLIADDSKLATSIDANKIMAQHFTEQGLDVEYFGQHEQKKLVAQLQDNQATLENIIGNIDPEIFYHKGASITRNITYLKLNQLNTGEEPTLFYFIDSDQEFQVAIQTEQGSKSFYAVNYLYYLDRIFSSTRSCVLTGKVVGDPPVSPSVMAGNFLQDVISFVSSMTKYTPDQDCLFHQHQKNTDDASYHDMADLFGFTTSSGAFQYDCELQGKHDHLRCFKYFSNKLSHFFDGEHPTRKSYFEHEDVLANLQAARTIYTGNYIFKPEALKFFIPFANLKLRMAGPVLGRLIKAQLASRFMSANLPMLHKRTVATIGQSEFRPGIEREKEVVDLSGEFTRQFFGDVMLFSVEKLTALGYPEKVLMSEDVSKIINATIKDMNEKYSLKHKEIIRNIEILKTLIDHSDAWWKQEESLQTSMQNFYDFINNIEHNFGAESDVYEYINSADNIDIHHHRIHSAIIEYSNDMASWQTQLNKKLN